MKHRMEQHNLDGQGFRAHRTYDVPSLDLHNYWASVTDIPCPAEGCGGTIRWAEAGYVPGYRICDGCKRHYLAMGNAAQATLVLFGKRR